MEKLTKEGMLININQEQRDKILNERLYEVIDISFGYKKHEEIEIVVKMDEIDREKN